MEANYDFKIFNELDDLEVANQRAQENLEKLAYIGNIICHYGLHEIVGVCLLHRHFNLQLDERVVREIVDNKFSIKPEAKANWDCVTPYSWKIKKNQLLEFTYYPLEFFDTKTVDLEIKKNAESLMKNQVFLIDIARKLSELEVMDTFGIAILFKEFLGLEYGNFLLETTDDNRMQMFELTSASSLGSDLAIKTLWKFIPHQQKIHLGSDSNRSLFWNFFARK
ncbi:hypothetical protein G7B40_033400 [Aetokthonos hydrillicola Thurmond2011]|jgi:hypothetical protein|uniref:Uncharacterized protein n=1 Tax=Aetokthonos hydrillicola Thurmond2011 TaxID=2712845 RepID=A0AAP5M8P8_9CYAN|nr:hypothetical protein [Aetokthonos hydrillicola]MBO3459542.1 hypothetical protein [Aetokthonos hydrillicola CCALA 1050]MBW4590291.1 hypothetical protein [Aetokthonos hydrillicola CCALA 1050]MDR9899421.1 hypothetical protein [Aetokthonos hydrillicola Thurmond2011]